MKRILLNLHRGLGNRLLPLLSGLALKEETGAALSLVWNLYDPPITLPPPPDPPYEFAVDHRELWEFGVPYDELGESEFVRQQAKQDSDVFCYSSPMPFRSIAACHQISHQLAPATGLRDQVDDLWSRLEPRFQPVVGVSIRQVCGFVKGTKLAPLPLYQQRLRELDQMLRGRFVVFVSSDTIAGVDAVREVLGDRRVVSREERHTYSSPSAIKAAMVDLWVLSRCDHRIGPPLSTLAMAAHWLGRGDAHHSYTTPLKAWSLRSVASLKGRISCLV